MTPAGRSRTLARHGSCEQFGRANFPLGACLAQQVVCSRLTVTRVSMQSDRGDVPVLQVLRDAVEARTAYPVSDFAVPLLSESPAYAAIAAISSPPTPASSRDASRDRSFTTTAAAIIACIVLLLCVVAALCFTLWWRRRQDRGTRASAATPGSPQAATPEAEPTPPLRSASSRKAASRKRSRRSASSKAVRLLICRCWHVLCVCRAVRVLCCSTPEWHFLGQGRTCARHRTDRCASLRPFCTTEILHYSVRSTPESVQIHGVPSGSSDSTRAAAAMPPVPAAALHPPASDASMHERLAWIHAQLDSIPRDQILMQQYRLRDPPMRYQGGAPPCSASTPPACLPLCGTLIRSLPRHAASAMHAAHAVNAQHGPVPRVASRC